MFEWLIVSTEVMILLLLIFYNRQKFLFFLDRYRLTNPSSSGSELCSLIQRLAEGPLSLASSDIFTPPPSPTSPETHQRHLSSCSSSLSNSSISSCVDLDWGVCGRESRLWEGGEQSPVHHCLCVQTQQDGGNQTRICIWQEFICVWKQERR